MRRIAVEEAFSIPEVWEALRDWAARASPDEAVRFPGLASIAPDDKDKIFYKNAERIFGVSAAPTTSGVSL